MAKTPTPTPASPLVIMEDVETGNRFMTYVGKDSIEFETRLDGDEPWFTQKDIAGIFGVTVPTVINHIQQFNDDGELDVSTTRDFEVVRQEGGRQVKRLITHYSLDVAFYVGYRVNSGEGKQFRRWATNALIQLATKGFVVNKRQLKGNADRLRELREIIADIRSDEATMYAELRNVCAMCKDYDPAAKTSRDFFANFQNRMLYAVTSNTAPELIVNSADARKRDMGLKTWPGQNITKADVIVAKNYLAGVQLEDLNRLVGMVLDFFEDQTTRGFLVSMADADERLGDILKLNKRHMLKGGGKVSRTAADEHAHAEFAKFKAIRKTDGVKQLAKATEDLLGNKLKRPSKRIK